MEPVDNYKKYFLINISLLAIVGILMVYSSSYMYAKENFGSSIHFVSKQFMFLLIGCGACFVASKMKATFWFKNIYLFNVFTSVLLLFTMTPLGVNIKGSQRWLNIGGMSVQPGEFVKYTLVICAVYYFNKFKDYTPKERAQYSLHFIIPLVLLISQPDFGTFSISLILVVFACFLSDFPRKYFMAGLGVAISGMTALLFAAPYRVKRLMVFLDPWSDPQNSGFQIIQSYLAFANGHIFGQGIGNSNEKLFYLPEAYNDFILSVLGEELGFVGIATIVLLFTSLTFFGFKLALTPKSRINQQIIACLVFSISLQSFLNMGVVLGLLPTKGLNLPFVSYGGSSLFANLLAIGMILACLQSKSQVFDEEEPHYYR